MKTRLFSMLLAITIFGIGCFSSDERTRETSSTEEEFPQTVELMGVIEVVSSGDRRLTLRLTNGDAEEISITETASISRVDEPMRLEDISERSFAEVFGTRDRATQLITARTIRIQDESGMVVTTPETNATVTSPLMLEGFANIGPDILGWRMIPSDSATTEEGTIPHEISDGFSSFRTQIFLPAMAEPSFVLEIFAFDTKTGKESWLQSIPLTLLTTKTSSFNVYFRNDTENPDVSCSTVSPTLRTIAETSAVGRAALLELLKGPKDDESKNGYRSELPDDLSFNAFIISGGVATVDISSSVTALALCRQQRIYSQITETLRRVLGIKSVVIMLDGDTNRIFQP